MLHNTPIFGMILKIPKRLRYVISSMDLWLLSPTPIYET